MACIPHPLPLDDPSSPRQRQRLRKVPLQYDLVPWSILKPHAPLSHYTKMPKSAQAVRGSQRERSKIAVFPWIRHQGLQRGLSPAPRGPPRPAFGWRAPAGPQASLASPLPGPGPTPRREAPATGPGAQTGKLTWPHGQDGVRVRGRPRLGTGAQRRPAGGHVGSPALRFRAGSLVKGFWVEPGHLRDPSFGCLRASEAAPLGRGAALPSFPQAAASGRVGLLAAARRSPLSGFARPPRGGIERGGDDACWGGAGKWLQLGRTRPRMKSASEKGQEHLVHFPPFAAPSQGGGLSRPPPSLGLLPMQ